MVPSVIVVVASSTAIIRSPLARDWITKSPVNSCSPTLRVPPSAEIPKNGPAAKSKLICSSATMTLLLMDSDVVLISAPNAPEAEMSGRFRERSPSNPRTNPASVRIKAPFPFCRVASPFGPIPTTALVTPPTISVVFKPFSESKVKRKSPRTAPPSTSTSTPVASISK